LQSALPSNSDPPRLFRARHDQPCSRWARASSSLPSLSAGRPNCEQAALQRRPDSAAVRAQPPSAPGILRDGPDGTPRAKVIEHQALQVRSSSSRASASAPRKARASSTRSLLCRSARLASTRLAPRSRASRARASAASRCVGLRDSSEASERVPQSFPDRARRRPQPGRAAPLAKRAPPHAERPRKLSAAKRPPARPRPLPRPPGPAARRHAATRLSISTQPPHRALLPRCAKYRVPCSARERRGPLPGKRPSVRKCSDAYSLDAHSMSTPVAHLPCERLVQQRLHRVDGPGLILVSGRSSTASATPS